MSTSTTEEITVSKGAAAPVAPPAPAGPMKIEPAQPPADVRARAGNTGQKLLERFKKSADERFAQRQEALDNGAALGEPTVGPYVAFDLYAFTPIQFWGPTPYQPSKIIAGGEWAVIYAVLVVNPNIDIPHGFAVPATVQLSERWYRVSMEQINLNNVTDGPDDYVVDQFNPPAAEPYTLLEFWFQAPYPGYKPELFEANLSADVLNYGQPYAAFASTIIDADTWTVQENIPLRYLVYPK